MTVTSVSAPPVTAAGAPPVGPSRRALCAVPAVAASALVALLPAPFRPDVAAWVGGAVLLSLAVCAVVRTRPWVAGAAALATALGALTQLRLGVAPARLGAVVAAATLAFVLATALGRGPRLTHLLAGSFSRRLVAVAALATGIVLRAVTVLGPNPAAGTLPGIPVQIGELTRYLVAAGFAVAVTELAAGRGAGPNRADRRLRVLTWSLLAAGVATLVLAKDLGPATLLLLGAAAAVVHRRGVRGPWVAAVVLAGAAAVPLAWASATLRTRVADVFHPDAQLRAALLAANSGGLIGPGPGRSAFVAGVPAIGSDYAVAALVADLGALVVVPVLIGLLLVYAGLVRDAAAGAEAQSTVAVTVATLLGGQACWSTLGAVGVIPLTGLNQPFLGLSGSSLIASAAALGLAVGVVDKAAADGVTTTGTAPGSRVVGGTAVVSTRVVALLAVVAFGMLAFGHQQMTDADQTRLPRGVIRTVDGHVVSLDGTNERIYPDGGLYADLGFIRWNYVHRGLDAVHADTLVCGGRLGVVDWVASLAHPVCKPADLVTSVDSRVQTAVAAALQGQTAEAAVVDARTGAVVALYSTASDRPGATSAARLGQGPPGSTMKIVTAAAGLLSGVAFDRAPATLFVDRNGQTLPNDARSTCPATDASTALAFSCNSVYGWVATEVGAAELERVARTYFGADQPFRFEGLDAAGLSTGLSGGGVADGPLARAGVGQESVRSSVLGVAVATSVVANAGIQPTYWPHLTAAVCAGRGPELPDRQPTVGPELPAAVAVPIYAGMRAAVERGTARRLTVPAGVEVAAKTGTAQVQGGIDSWVTAIVDHRYVISLVVHRPRSESAAVRALAPILPALPAAPALPVCPPTPGPA